MNALYAKTQQPPNHPTHTHTPEQASVKGEWQRIPMANASSSGGGGGSGVDGGIGGGGVR